MSNAPAVALQDSNFSLLLDPHKRIIRFTHDGVATVAKLCSEKAGKDERDRAIEARKRITKLAGKLPLALEVVVPEFVITINEGCMLVSPDLGCPLSTSTQRASEILPHTHLIEVLSIFMGAGIEAPGFVPRNLFYNNNRIFIIDWEAATFCRRISAYNSLSVMKLDIAWSDVYRKDPGIRHNISVLNEGSPILDSFEKSFRDLTDEYCTPRVIREKCINLTLTSELYLPFTETVTASELGHLVDEILPQTHSVLYTTLTAYMRNTLGNKIYAKFISDLWTDIQKYYKANLHDDPLDNLQNNILASIFICADRYLCSTDIPLTILQHNIQALNLCTGWDSAIDRAKISEKLLVRICDLVLTAFDPNPRIELILRGSLAQGLVSRKSDLDFELSSPQWPNGHHNLENLVLDALAAFNILAEASNGRPLERDFVDSASGVTRDLHEWMELRQTGSRYHNPGWLQQILNPTTEQFCKTQSCYEQSGRQQTAKYVWFEARALLARWIFCSTSGVVPVTTPHQLDIIRENVGGADYIAFKEIIHIALTLREHDAPEHHEVQSLQIRIDELRNKYNLPGPN
ncbi:MAG: hypothetical protein P8179_14685 [Candidatus Thiodiazotropha sp.]